MKYFKVNHVIDGTIYASVDAYGVNIVKDILPEVVDFIQKNTPKEFVIVGLNGVTLHLPSYVTLEQAKSIYEKSRDEYKKEQRLEREAKQRQEEEDKLKQIEMEKKKAEHDAYVYHSANEANLDLTKINPIDLTSEKTTMQEAVSFYKEVMTVVSKCDGVHFTDEDRKIFQDTMKKLGCVAYDNANEKFHGDSEGKKGGYCVFKKDNIEFPLIVTTKLLGAETAKDFNWQIEAHSRELSGDPSLVLQWIEEQKEPEMSR